MGRWKNSEKLNSTAKDKSNLFNVSSLGIFEKVLATNFHTKVDQIISKFLAIPKKCLLKSKNCSILDKVREKWAAFCNSIWFWPVWPDGIILLILTSFTKMEIGPMEFRICQIRLNFCQIQNKPSKTCQRLYNFYLRYKIPPNLVTLVLTSPGRRLEIPLFDIFHILCYCTNGLPLFSTGTNTINPIWL